MPAPSEPVCDDAFLTPPGAGMAPDTFTQSYWFGAPLDTQKEPPGIYAALFPVNLGYLSLTGSALMWTKWASDNFWEKFYEYKSSGSYRVRTVVIAWDDEETWHVVSDTTSQTGPLTPYNYGGCEVYYIDELSATEWVISGSGLTGYKTVTNGQADFYQCPDLGECFRIEGFKCCACSGGDSWDPVTQWCYDDPCEAGYAYCEFMGVCRPVLPPLCSFELNCVYNKDTCDWDCDPIPNCGGTYHWQMSTCSCAECDPGYYWCNAYNRCIKVDPPDCYTELGCFWDRTICEFACNAPNCDPGYVWDTLRCECVDECPPGECWCEDPYSYVGSCIACTEPDCADERNCVWNTFTCDWECDDTDEICGPSRTWLPAPDCRCENSDNVFILRDNTEQFIVFHRSTDGTMDADLHGADDELVETNEIDDDTSCSNPSFWLEDGVIIGTYLRGTSPKMAVSRTHGRTYEVYEIPGNYTSLTSVEHRGRVVALGFSAGNWYQRVGKIGEDGLVAAADWSDEVDTQIGTSWVPPLTPTGVGRLRDPEDNRLDFVWEATDGVFRVVNCKVLSLDAIGEWDSVS